MDSGCRMQHDPFGDERFCGIHVRGQEPQNRPSGARSRDPQPVFCADPEAADCLHEGCLPPLYSGNRGKLRNRFHLY